MTSLRKFIPAILISAVIVGCSSGSKTSVGTDATSTTSTIVAGGSTSTTAAATTTPATVAPTTAAPVVATTPATTPQIITSFSVSDPAACAAPDSTFVGPNPEVTVSWTVVGADSVTVSMDSKGGIWNNGLPLKGSTSVPASCDSNGHNTHTYYVIAIKNGSEIASKKATRGH